MEKRSVAVAGAVEPPTAVLRASGLTKSFAGVRALRGVDFDLLPGEIHALVGENGAGKSTLAKIVSGAYVADSGRLWLDGRELTGTLGTTRRPGSRWSTRSRGSCRT